MINKTCKRKGHSYYMTEWSWNCSRRSLVIDRSQVIEQQKRSQLSSPMQHASPTIDQLTLRIICRSERLEVRCILSIAYPLQCQVEHILALANKRSKCCHDAVLLSGLRSSSRTRPDVLWSLTNNSMAEMPTAFAPRNNLEAEHELYW